MKRNEFLSLTSIRSLFGSELRRIGLLSGFLFGSSMVWCFLPAVAADVPSTRVLQGGTEATEYIMEGVPKYRDGMSAFQSKDYAAAEALFKAGAAKLGTGQERARAECLYRQAACLELLGRADDAGNVYKAALQLFERYDPGNPMKTEAIKSLRELPPEKTGIEKDRLMVAPPEMRIQTAIKQTAELAGGAGIPVLDVIDERAVPQMVLKSFVEMSCIETAELGANASNVQQRWQPLMVHNEPAAFTIGQKFPTINVTVNKRRYEVPVDLPDAQGLHRILLVSNKEKICAIDMDSHESWLLKMKPHKDGTVSDIGWSKLTHVKPGFPRASARGVGGGGDGSEGAFAQNSGTEDDSRRSTVSIFARGGGNGEKMNDSGGMSRFGKDLSGLEDLESKLGQFGGGSSSRRGGSSAGLPGESSRGGQNSSATRNSGYSQNDYSSAGGSSSDSDSGF